MKDSAWPKIATPKYVLASGAPLSKKTILESKSVFIDRRKRRKRTYNVICAESGYESAGSMCRWVDKYYAVQFSAGATIHGRRFGNKADAMETFNNWTKQFDNDSACGKIE